MESESILDASPEKAIAQLKEMRGITDETPMLSDPKEFVEMNRAVERIRRAIDNKEKIRIFGDYDADGITAAAQLKRFFDRYNANADVYLPHREKEGYGMKQAIIDLCEKDDVKLLITVDTGITAHDEIVLAQARGIDVIVTDHHSPRIGRPPAYAVLHPMIPTQFANQNLSGSGMAFMLVGALEESIRGERNWTGIEEDLILATIGTVADLVPLIGENRTLVQYGLRFAHTLKPTSTIYPLINGARKNGEKLRSSDIAFRIAPQINASGRIDHPSLALDALLHGGPAIDRLKEMNETRKTKTIELSKHAIEKLDHAQAFIVIADENFHPGLIGLIAGQLTQTYGKPAMVCAIKDGICTASLRSISEVDLTKIFKDPNVQSLLIAFGGHKMAAGCTLATENLQKLTEILQALTLKKVKSIENLVPNLSIIGELQNDHLVPIFGEMLSSLEPFGMHNDEPLFILKNATMSDIRAVGNEGAHLQCRIGNTHAIGFRLGEFMEKCDAPVDLACSVEMNEWNGSKRVQLVIEDIRKSV